MANAPEEKRKVKRPRARKWLIFAVLVLLVAGGAVWLSAGLGDMMAPRVEARLARELNARVAMEGFDFGLFTGARIEQMRILPEPAGSEPSLPEIRLRDVEIDHRLAGLLLGDYRVRKIRVGDLEAEIDPHLLQWAASLGQDEAERTDAFPEIELSRAVIRFDLPGMSRPVEVSRVRLSAWQPDVKRILGIISFSAGKNAVRIQFNAIPEQSYVETDIMVNGFDLSFLPAIAYDGLQIDPAEIDAHGMLTGTLIAFLADSERQSPAVTGQFNLSGLSVRHPDTDLAVTNGTARILVSENTITIRAGDFNFAGGSVEIPAAGFQIDRAGLDRFWCRAEGDNLDLVPFFKEEYFRQVPDEFQPQVLSGTFSGSLHAQWTPAGGMKYGADVALQDVSAALERRGVEIHSLDAEGSIASTGRVVIRQARGRLFGGRAEALGSFELAGDQLVEPHIEVLFSDIEQSESLVGMLPDHVKKAIALIGLKGGTAEGTLGLEPHGLTLSATVNARRVELPDLPFSFDDAEARIKWASGAKKVLFEDCRGFISGSPVEGSGALLLDKPLRADISLRGKYLPLQQPVLEWLHLETGQWQIKGNYDLVIQAENWQPVRSSFSESFSGINAEADLRNVDLSHPEYGQVARNCYGNLALGSDGLQLTNLRGDLYDIGFRGSGSLPLDGSASGPYLHFETENISLGSKLFDRLPFDIGLADIRLTGQCRLQGEFRRNGGRRYDGNITAVVYPLEMSPGGVPISAGGTAQIRFGAERLSDLEVSGKVDLGELSVGALEGDRLTAVFNYNNSILNFQNINISAYGGKIASEETWVNLDNRVWNTRADIAHLDFESLMGAFGIEGREAPAGVLRAGLRLSGTGFNPETFTGIGEVKIDRGVLYSFPLLVSVLSVFDLHLPSSSPVTNAYGIFKVGGGRIRVEDLVFTGGSVPIHMEGRINLKQGVAFKEQQVNLLVTVAKSKGLIDQIPILNLIKHYTVDLLRSIVFQARVKGSFDDYEIDALSSPVTKPIQKMWSLIEKITPTPPGGD